MSDVCPECNAVYPDVYTDSWSGGNDIVTTTHRCKNCGARFKTIYNITTHEMRIEVQELRYNNG